MTNDHHECCLRCQSRRVVIGRFVGTESSISRSALFRCFQPSGFWGKLVYYLGLRPQILLQTASESFVCLDCGTCWSSIDPKHAESEIRRRGDQDVKRRLGLVEKPLILEDDLA
jgi:hypothetical protein